MKTLSTLFLAGSVVFNSYSQKVADYSHQITNQTLVIKLQINKSKEQKTSEITMDTCYVKNYAITLIYDNPHADNRLRFIFKNKNKAIDTLEVSHPLYREIEIFNEDGSMERSRSTLEKTNYLLRFPYREEFSNIKIEEIINNKKVNKEYFSLEK